MHRKLNRKRSKSNSRCYIRRKIQNL